MKKIRCRNSISFLTRFLKFPLLIITGRNFPKYYSNLKKSQYFPLEKLRELQLGKLTYLIDEAYYKVSFYNELYSEKGIKPGIIKSLNDITKLPIINKKDLKKAYPTTAINKEICRDKIIENSTSGSTGKPFVFALNWYKKDMIESLKMRNFDYVGYGYGRKYFSLWGFTPNLSFITKLFQKLILKRHLLSSLDMDDDKKEQYSKILIKNPNRFLEGYSSALVILAKYMILHGYKANLCGVISSAETLVPEHRKILEEAYGCEIFNRYGTREFGDIAIECMEHKGLHINMESFIVEIVDENDNTCKPGEEGRIIVTDLDNSVMPFIRFDTEDSAAFKQHNCSCGRNSYLFKDPSGRIVDTIKTPEGKHLSFGFFVLKFEDYPIVDQFQVNQVDSKSIILKIVKNHKFTEESFKPLLESVKEYCYPMIVKVKFVDEISLETSGKMRIVKGLSLGNNLYYSVK